MLPRRPNYLLPLLFATQVCLAEQDLDDRTAFEIPLANLSVVLQRFREDVEEIRIKERDSQDEWIITPTDEVHIKRTNQGETRRLERESVGPHQLISEHEARQLNEVCKGFVKTLSMFEKDLQRERWDRCLYLDGFFPRFLRGFSYLYCAARGLSRPTGDLRVAEEAYDVSLSSPKSDERVRHWRNDPEYCLKLRIITRELAHQLRLWQKQDIGNPKRNPEIHQGEKVEHALGLFLRMYFNKKPPPEVPEKGRHL